MRRHFATIIIFAALMPSAASAGPPNDLLLAGTLAPSFINPAANGVWCMVDGAGTNFLTNNAPVATLMTFSSIIYAPTGSVGPAAYRLGGQATLLFKDGSSTAGQIRFSNDPTIPTKISRPDFSGYSAVYHPANHALAVSFNILFPNCTLPISAEFRN